MIDIDELKALANARVASIAADCLPNGREENGYWRTGSIADEPGQSLAVTLRGADQGMWCDHACSGPEGGGNILQLVAWTKFGGDIGAAIAWVKSFLGLDGLDPGRLRTVRAEANAAAQKGAQRHEAEQAEKRRWAKSLFLSGGPIQGTPAEAYLRGRHIDLAQLGHVPNSLRYRADVSNKESGRKLPCLLAGAVDLEGNHVATHRTWLGPDGVGGWGKADLEDPKMTLGGSLGGFIPLWRSEADRKARRSLAEILPGTDVYVSEGIEDGLSVAMAKPEARVICAIALRKIPHLQLPEQMGRLIIVGQRDTHPKTLAALEAAIAAHQDAGRRVFLTPPPRGFKDVNDALRFGNLQRGRAA